MKIDPLLLKAFKAALGYGAAAFLFFYFTDDELSLADKGVKAAATAGIFMLLFYVVARVLKR